MLLNASSRSTVGPRPLLPLGTRGPGDDEVEFICAFTSDRRERGPPGVMVLRNGDLGCEEVLLWLWKLDDRSPANQRYNRFSSPATTQVPFSLIIGDRTHR